MKVQTAYWFGSLLPHSWLEFIRCSPGPNLLVFFHLQETQFACFKITVVMCRQLGNSLQNKTPALKQNAGLGIAKGELILLCCEFFVLLRTY